MPVGRPMLPGTSDAENPGCPTCPTGVLTQPSGVTLRMTLFSGSETYRFERKTKRTRKREFLDEMNLVVPWAELGSLIAPHAPQPGAKGAILDQLEQTKARIRAKVEHPFRVIKRQFGYVKVKYRGLAKNTANLMTLFALSNIWMVRKRLLNIGGRG